METAKDIVERYRDKNDREKTSFYLSKAVYEKFRKACEDVPAGKIVEHLMQKFIESKKNGKKIDL